MYLLSQHIDITFALGLPRQTVSYPDPRLRRTLQFFVLAEVDRILINQRWRSIHEVWPNKLYLGALREFIEDLWISKLRDQLSHVHGKLPPRRVSHLHEGTVADDNGLLLGDAFTTQV